MNGYATNRESQDPSVPSKNHENGTECLTDETTLVSQKSAVEESSDSSNILRDGGEVDVVLISEQQEGLGDAAVQNPSLRVGAHHICHCRYLQNLHS